MVVSGITWVSVLTLFFPRSLLFTVLGDHLAVALTGGVFVVFGVAVTLVFRGQVLGPPGLRLVGAAWLAYACSVLAVSVLPLHARWLFLPVNGFWLLGFPALVLGDVAARRRLERRRPQTTPEVRA
jgi:hypothetical protein